MTSSEFQEVDNISLVRWIERSYGVTPIESLLYTGEKIAVFSWENETVQGRAYLRDNSLLKVSIVSSDTYTLREIVDGLGKPEVVLRDVMMPHGEDVYYRIELDYPSLGIYLLYGGIGTELQMLSPEDDLAIYLGENMRIQPTVVCTIPYATMEEVLRADPEIGEDDLEHYLPFYTLWPGMNRWLSFVYSEN